MLPCQVGLKERNIMKKIKMFMDYLQDIQIFLIELLVTSAGREEN